MESIPVSVDSCSRYGPAGSHFRSMRRQAPQPAGWKTPHDLEGCAIAMMLDAQPRHPFWALRGAWPDPSL